MDPDIDLGLVYGACRERLTALVRDLSPEQAARPTPACPGWTIHDVVAHLAGVVADVGAGNLDGVGSEAWTAAQVDARRDRSIAELLAEWEAGSPTMEDTLRAFGGMVADMGVADVWNHEQDVRGALGVDGGRDPAAEEIAIRGYGTARGGAISAAGLAPLRFVAGSHTVVSGPGEPEATLTAEPFELARAVAGRRTADQLRSYRWEGDAEPYVAVLAAGAPSAPLPR
jgi:uncharacterized protein (TIGR03083 family)